MTEVLKDRTIGALGVFAVAASGGTEYRFYKDHFHFGSLLVTRKNLVAFRPHPDQADPNGWGSTVYLAPYLAGGDSAGAVRSIIANQANQQILVRIGGNISSGRRTSYGTWSAKLHFIYSPSTQIVHAEGTLTVSLASKLSAAGRDLNLNKIASNYLVNVPLLPGGTGDTGDIEFVRVEYARIADHRDFTWRPQPARHYPTDHSNFSRITLHGQTNRVDTLALGYDAIQVACKPTIMMSYSCTTGDAPIAVGMQFDARKQQNPYADNIGIHQQIRQRDTTGTVLGFYLTLDSRPMNQRFVIAGSPMSDRDSQTLA